MNKQILKFLVYFGIAGLFSFEVIHSTTVVTGTLIQYVLIFMISNIFILLLKNGKLFEKQTPFPNWLLFAYRFASILLALGMVLLTKPVIHLIHGEADFTCMVECAILFMTAVLAAIAIEYMLELLFEV